jgi:hypothetical protein
MDIQRRFIMSKRTFLVLAGLLAAGPAIAGGIADDDPCADATGSTVTLTNNQTMDCVGATTANPAAAGSNATVTSPPPPLDPIRDNPGTSSDRIRGTYGNNTGTTGTVGTKGVGTPGPGVPDSAGTVRESTTGTTTRDSTTGITTRDSTVPTTGTGVTGTGGTGSVGGTGTSSTGTAGGTGGGATGGAGGQ